MPKSNARLKWLYTHWNRRFFGSRLPANTAVMFDYCDGKNANMAYIHLDGVPVYSIIQIAPIVRRVGHGFVEMTLFHEMAHMDLAFGVSCNVKHGKQFQRKMRELANAGAFERYW